MKVAIVIPCYRVKAWISELLERIGSGVDEIFIVDDCCPEGTGKFVESQCRDPRVQVLYHSVNGGVGAATITGYRAALSSGAEIVVKMDGDGQMDPALIPVLIAPILNGRADYCKGNRFFRLDTLSQMPALRLFGNAVLSFINKVTSGYWNIMDPTNGFTAVHAGVLRLLPLEKVEKRYFFESDMLFRLGTVRAVIEQVPMSASYSDETSSLSIPVVLLQFPFKYVLRLVKRIFYSYFLRDFNVCTIEMITGLLLSSWGVAFGLLEWYRGIQSGLPATTGTVMLSALPLILGFQLLLAALTFDIMNVPRAPLQRHFLPDSKSGDARGQVIGISVKTSSR